MRAWRGGLAWVALGLLAAGCHKGPGLEKVAELKSDASGAGLIDPFFTKDLKTGHHLFCQAISVAAPITFAYIDMQSWRPVQHDMVFQAQGYNWPHVVWLNGEAAFVTYNSPGTTKVLIGRPDGAVAPLDLGPEPALPEDIFALEDGGALITLTGMNGFIGLVRVDKALSCKRLPPIMVLPDNTRGRARPSVVVVDAGLDGEDKPYVVAKLQVDEIGAKRTGIMINNHFIKTTSTQWVLCRPRQEPLNVEVQDGEGGAYARHGDDLFLFPKSGPGSCTRYQVATGHVDHFNLPAMERILDVSSVDPVRVQIAGDPGGLHQMLALYQTSLEAQPLLKGMSAEIPITDAKYILVTLSMARFIDDELYAVVTYDGLNGSAKTVFRAHF